jgi:hypothetical protein
MKKRWLECVARHTRCCSSNALKLSRRYFFTGSRSGATHSRLARRSRTTSKL